MSGNVLETEWWRLDLPPEWWAEAEGESILIGDRDGVGCIEISTLHKETGEFDPAMVRRIAGAEAERALDWSEVQVGEFSGVCARYLEEGAAIREWYVTHGALLLFVTYSCEAQHLGLDDAAVEAILDTLVVL